MKAWVAANVSSRRGVTFTGTPSLRIAVFGFSVDPMLGVICKICGFNSWLAHKSDPAISSRPHETPVLILAQCRAQGTPEHRPGEEFARAAATGRRSCRRDKRLRKRRASQTRSYCSRREKLRAAGSASPSVFADRVRRTAHPSTPRADCSRGFEQSPRVVSCPRKDPSDNDPQSLRDQPASKSSQKP